MYGGLNLKSPIIVSSSGLTNSVERIRKMAQAGAGAVVLKSLFEEQIRHEVGTMSAEGGYPEAADYLRTYAKENSHHSQNNGSHNMAHTTEKSESECPV